MDRSLESLEVMNAILACLVKMTKLPIIVNYDRGNYKLEVFRGIRKGF